MMARLAAFGFALALALALGVSPIAGAARATVVLSLTLAAPDAAVAAASAMRAELRGDGVTAVVSVPTVAAALEAARIGREAAGIHDVDVPCASWSVIEVHGDHVLGAPIALGPKDSCTEIAGASDGSGRLLGGPLLPPSGWTPAHRPDCKLDPHTLAFDLRPLAVQYGQVHSGPPSSCGLAGAELFVGGIPAPLARFPNAPSAGLRAPWTWARATNVSQDLQAGTITVNVTGDRQARWVEESDAYLHAFWQFDWADEFVSVLSSDAKGATFSNGTAYLPSKGDRVMGLNLLSELDAENEWYLDRNEGTLYWLPPPGPFRAAGEALAKHNRKHTSRSPSPSPSSEEMLGPGLPEVAVSNATGLLTITQASSVLVRDLTLWYSRGIAVAVVGGNNVTIASCDASNHGTQAVHLDGTTRRSRVIGLTATGLGCAGVSAVCGDPKTLERGECAVQNCTLRFNQRRKRTYTPSVGFGGVGNVYDGNTLSDGPHNAMQGLGNDLVFRWNDVRRFCQGSIDAGAWYSGRSWAKRNHTIAWNLFEDIFAVEELAQKTQAQNAVYWDDQLSDGVVVGNTFRNCDRGILFGGGRRLHALGNAFQGNMTEAVHLDDRGLNWQTAFCEPGGIFWQELDALNYTQPPYSRHYPELLSLRIDHPCAPVHAVLVNNTYGPGVKNFTNVGPQQASAWNVTLAGNEPVPAHAHDRWRG